MAEKKKTEATKPVATIKTPVTAEVKTPEVKAAAPAAKAETKTETKTAAKKAAPAKKATTAKKAAPAKKATTAKKTETKAAAPKKEVAKKAAPAKKAAAPKAEEAVKANIVLQYGDLNVTYDTIIQNSKNNYAAEMGGNIDDIKKLSVYVKPEECAAYYVVNDKVQGRIGL